MTDGLIARNPCTIAGGGAERSPERPVASLAQVWALAEAVEPRFPRSCSLPRSQACASGSWQAYRGCIDLAEGTITVVQALVERDDHSLLIGPPKTEAGRRTFTVPAALIPELEKHLVRYVGPADDALVFTGAQGAPLRRGNWSVKWQAATKAVGLPGFRLHDLRHTCNTLTAATGASTRELMHRMGHASARAALRYQHATRDRDAVIARGAQRDHRSVLVGRLTGQAIKLSAKQALR